MRASSGFLFTTAKRCWRTTAAAAVLLLLGTPAWAQSEETNEPAAAVRLLTTVPIKGTAASPNTKMFSFDISFVDPATGLYYLADRSNAALDVIDTTGKFTGTADTLFGQIGGSAFNFAGDTGSTSTSGPNGVVAASPCIFVTDTGVSGGRVVSINSNVSFVQKVSDVSTGGTTRADELAYDPADGLLLVINNAEKPPYGTLITVNKLTCALTLGTKITFNTANGVNATNGAEQPAWDPNTKKFYLSIPEIGGPGDGTGTAGGVIRISTTGVIEKTYPINFCQPAGLTVGPNGDLLVGCNSVFDTLGNKCTAVVPSPSATGTPAGAPATCTGIAYPQEVICNPTVGRDCTGNALVSVQGVGGGDEVWFNKGDGNYYVTAGNDPVGPVFGVIASVLGTSTNILTQLVPTLPPVPAVTTGTSKHGAGTVHSITACSTTSAVPCTTNKVYVALPANTAYSLPGVNQGGSVNCAQGCVAVFGVP